MAQLLQGPWWVLFLLSILSLSLCTCVFFHMRSLTVGVGNWSWVSQSEQQKCNIQSWKYNNYIELLGVLVCIITFSSLFWMCQLLKYNKIIYYYNIHFLFSDQIVMEFCGAGSVSDLMKIRNKTVSKTVVDVVFSLVISSSYTKLW